MAKGGRPRGADGGWSRGAKWAVGSVVAVMVVALVVSLGFLIYRGIYSGRVAVMVAPSTAVVRVGEMEFSAMGEHEVVPGEYAVSVSAEGFEPRTGRLKVVAGSVAQVSLYLEPTAENAGWYDAHPEDALVMGEIVNAKRLAEVQEVLAGAPILAELPATFEYYTEGMAEYVKYVISYEFDDSVAGYHLVIKDYTGGAYEAALAWIRERGGATEGVVYEDLTGNRL